MAHHGYVDVQSTPGNGTTISLFFPVPKEITVDISDDNLEPEPNGTETILVVEDELDVSFFLETLLRSHGYHVLSAKDAEEALKIFQEQKNEIKLIFSDIGLPKTDGILLCEKIKKMKPGVAIILASGYPTKEFKPRIYKLSPDAFLSKPYTPHDILQTVHKVLSGSRVLHLAD
jgi:two-component system, cell cycle sensor histidine kinase and response regulator CckA